MTKIISIKLEKHIVPTGSCGTGYSEPDVFEIIDEDKNKTKVVIDIWYRCPDDIIKVFKQEMDKTFPEGYNFDETFDMYLDEIANKTCPYSKEKIYENSRNK